jgi:SMI1 / KNR4 family (SUKH-1)
MNKADLAGLGYDLAFVDPAEEAALAGVERQLGVRLPRQLRELLLDSDGVLDGRYGFSVVWPAARIATDRVSDLVFFADAGNGDQFGFAMTAGAIERDEVLVWDHEDDSRTPVAPDFDTFLRGWLSGELRI